MNRRNLLKGIFSLVALFPFLPLIKKKQNEPIILGIDKAKPGEDQTILILCDPLSDQEFQLMKNSFISTTVNCRCAFELRQNERRIERE